jgi:perosamine synthetase
MNTQTNEFARNVVEAIRSVLPVKENTPLHEPYFAGRESIYLKECVDSGWVSSVGQFVNRFEQMLCDYTSSPYAVVTVNGTSALHICLLLAGVSEGDEVLAPALTFVATANAITYCGAVPHFIDVEERTLGIDANKLSNYLQEISELRDGICYNRYTDRPIRAVVPMHTFGHPVDIDPLQEVCRRYKLVMVEDATESLGTLYKGKHAGTLGKISCLSFNGNKIITTGGGGAVLTADKELARQAKHLTTQAKLTHRWEFVHDQIAYNYRMPNINAALGCAQLEQLPTFLEKKRLLAARYQTKFKDFKGAKIFKEQEYARSNYWLNVLLLDKGYIKYRDDILALSNDSGLMTRPAWTLMHNLPMYQECPRMNLDESEALAARIINIPSSVNLGG